MKETPANAVKKWYVLRTFSGHEKKVRDHLLAELHRNNIEDRIGDVLIPSETIFEMRGGKKRTREKTLFPGYIFIEAFLDNELIHFITGTPSVVGFPSVGKEPTPMRPDEINRIIGKVKESRESGEQPEIPFKSGDPVKVVDGPFNNFSGFVEEVFPDKMKVRVMVSIFGRKTPLELDYLQIEHES
jgi:transcriptional antiterminator NusG